MHLQLQVQEKSVMSCVMAHLLTPSLPPLLHGQVILQYNYKKCLFLSDVFNSSSCLLRTHIIYWLEADQYVFSRGLSGYRARRRVSDSRRPVLGAGLSLNK
jgi:hypothetical protein